MEPFPERSLNEERTGPDVQARPGPCTSSSRENQEIGVKSISACSAVQPLVAAWLLASPL
jgi:hypothetical protein